MNKLLIVMDEWEKLEQFEQRFNPYFEVFTAPFGAYGIELLQLKKPDCILVDLSFEDMDEKEFQSLVRARVGFEHTPVFYISERHGTFATPSTQDICIRNRLAFEPVLSAMKELGLVGA